MQCDFEGHGRMTKNKEETKTASKIDLDEAVENYECANMLKVGMITYFTDNNIKINSDKDFEKAVKEYLNLKIGE